MSTATLPDRINLLVQALTQENRRYKHLEDLTGIPADRWKAFALGRQRPTAEMIEAVCLVWPEHAYWIATGLTDSVEGSVGIPAAYATDLNLELKPQPFAAIQYKRTKAEIRKSMITEGRSEMTEVEIQTIYAVRSRRESERFDDLDRRRRNESGAGYFDPRLLKFSKIDEGSADGD